MSPTTTTTGEVRRQHTQWANAHARLMETGKPVVPTNAPTRPVSPFVRSRRADFIGPPTRFQWLFPNAIVELDATGRVKESPRWPDAAWMRIAKQVARKHGLTVKEIRSERRDRPVVAARFEAFWRCHKEAAMSLPAIGRAFGDRDHTTVLHGLRTYARRMKEAAVDAN